MIEIKEVISKKEFNVFLKFPWNIYKGDPNWVPHLLMDMRAKFDPKQNPFFDHAEIKIFMAFKADEPVGRIVATVNDAHNNTFEEKTGFFGFFECIDDQETANSLLDAAQSWLKEKGQDTMRGPANFSSNDDWGALLDSFDSPPVVMMPYNPKYYLDLFEKYGLKKEKDVLAYKMATDHEFPERINKIIDYVKKKQNVVIRTIDMKNYYAEIEHLKSIYNSAWEHNWGFIPMNEKEMEHLAKELKPVINPKVVFFATVDDKPIGISVCIPNANEAIAKLKNGKLFPFGIFKLLFHMKRVQGCRLIVLGLIKEYRNKGIEPLFFQATKRAAWKLGWKWGEMSWILEDNMLMRSSIEKAGGKIYKTYRIYDKKIS